MTESNNSSDIAKAELNQETSLIAWHELQRFFATGQAIYVAPELGLIDVALQVSENNSSQIQDWTQALKIAKVNDDQARQWYESDASVWAVVVKPWVLVQLDKPKLKQ